MAQTLLASACYDCLLLDTAFPNADLRAVIAAARAVSSLPAVVVLLPGVAAPLPDELSELTDQVIPIDTLTPSLFTASIRGALRVRLNSRCNCWPTPVAR